ncbi:MAG: lactate racemase domain-containing protein, partial [Planctomycetota bacterium]
MKLHPIHQSLRSAPIDDVAAETRAQLDAVGSPPRGRVAVTGGSRGIRNIVAILRTAGEWLRENGAEPFLAPCMGSHNGATAAGQRAMLETLGMTETAVEMPIHSSMDVRQVGETPTGEPVWMDRHCHDADGVLVVNRVKLHTSFG